jgi:hypothetical protein
LKKSQTVLIFVEVIAALVAVIVTEILAVMVHRIPEDVLSLVNVENVVIAVIHGGALIVLVHQILSVVQNVAVIKGAL